MSYYPIYLGLGAGTGAQYTNKAEAVAGSSYVYELINPFSGHIEFEWQVAVATSQFNVANVPVIKNDSGDYSPLIVGPLSASATMTVFIDGDTETGYNGRGSLSIKLRHATAARSITLVSKFVPQIDFTLSSATTITPSADGERLTVVLKEADYASFAIEVAVSGRNLTGPLTEG